MSSRFDRARPTAAVLAALFAGAACGSDVGPPLPPEGDGPASIVVDNESQYTLEELRFHRSEDYRASSNLLPTELAMGGEVVVHARGSWFVTVMREKNYRGPIRAFTTETSFAVADGVGYRLAVFDEQFRLQRDHKRAMTPTDIVLDQ
ncbi:MAG: hypothetical protein HYV07_33430 [Deltaproteobacteria bacterium]|nr:hypothetical protein [Deltaproteobacteria bacterium]